MPHPIKPRHYLCLRTSDTGHNKRCQHVRRWLELGMAVIRDGALAIIDERLCWRLTVKDKCNGCKRAKP